MRCIVKSCEKSISKRAGNISFHKFPVFEQNKEKWMKILGLDKIKPWSVVCSNHFHESDYICNDTKVKRLYPSAVPHLLEHFTEPQNKDPLCKKYIRDINDHMNMANAPVKPNTNCVPIGMEPALRESQVAKVNIKSEPALGKSQHFQEPQNEDPLCSKYIRDINYHGDIANAPVQPSTNSVAIGKEPALRESQEAAMNTEMELALKKSQVVRMQIKVLPCSTSMEIIERDNDDHNDDGDDDDDIDEKEDGRKMPLQGELCLPDDHIFSPDESPKTQILKEKIRTLKQYLSRNRGKIKYLREIIRRKTKKMASLNDDIKSLKQT